jgi:hypothetical protein
VPTLQTDLERSGGILTGCDRCVENSGGMSKSAGSITAAAFCNTIGRVLTIASVLVLAMRLAVTQDEARILGTGDPDARHDALARILAVPPAERTADVWQALRQEVERIVACLDVRTRSAAESQTLQCDVRPRSEDNYLPDLIEALSQSRDPSMIPTLIKVAPSGAIAASGLLRFGDLAVPALIESAMSSRSGPWVYESGGAMFTLARMLEQPVPDAVQSLSSASRLRITDTARTLLHTKLTWANQIPIIALVLATKDVALRAEVEALATDASEWRRRGVTDQARITQGQNSIRFALTRHPKP